MPNPSTLAADEEDDLIQRAPFSAETLELEQALNDLQAYMEKMGHPVFQSVTI